MAFFTLPFQTLPLILFGRAAAAPFRCVLTLVASTRRLDSQRVEPAADSQTRLANVARNAPRLAVDSQPTRSLDSQSGLDSQAPCRLAVNSQLVSQQLWWSF